MHQILPRYLENIAHFKKKKNNAKHENESETMILYTEA